MKKRILSLLLVATMLLSLVPMTVFAIGTSYAITNGTPENAKETNHGYITIDKDTAEESDTVTVEAYPAEGYQLKTLTATPVAPTISTIADVLATVEEFPEDTSGGTSPVAPSGAWSNGNGGFAFIYGRGNAFILRKDSYTYGFLTTPVTKKENCYTAIISYGSLTFNMENGILTSFEFTADPSKPNAAVYVGTYAPASTPSAKLKTITPAKQQDGTYQFTMPGYAVTVTAEFEEIPVTIADILPSNFPASDEDNSWCNSNNDNVYIYKTDSDLVFYDNTEDCYSVPLSTPLTKEENPEVSYVYSEEDTIIQFNMTGDNDDELENIVVNNCTIPTCIGTYNPIEIVTYDVTYNANGATSGSAPANQTKTASVDLTLATNTGNLAKAGYTFAGWNTKADGSGTHYDTGATYTTDAALTLYAEWIEAPATKTIAEILPDDFPTSSSTAWITEQGFKCRLDSSNLRFDIDDGEYIAAITATVTPSGDDYVYTDEDGSVTFNMENGKLTSITVMVNGDDKTYVYASRFKVTVFAGIYVKEYLADEGTAYSVNGATLTVGTEADTATPIEGKEFDCWKIGETPVTEDGTITEDTTFVATYKAAHIHNPVKVTGQAATETAAGFKDYYACDCGALFEDENGTTPIVNLDTWKSSTGNGYLAPLVHTVTPVNGQDATDTEAGYKAYYECKNCGKYYEDVSGLVEITDLAKWKAQGGAGYIPKLEKEPTSPKPGDNSHMALWLILMALSSIGLCACLVLGKKRNKC